MHTQNTRQQFEIEKNILFMIKEYTRITKNKEYILVFSPFLSLEPERKKEKRRKKFREENVYELSCT